MAITKMDNPFELFQSWLEEAKACGSISEPTAMTLSTAGADGRPSSRIVLLKAADKEGFVFYTNLASRKGREIEENPWASLCFYWMALDRQVRIEGRVNLVSNEEADRYFASRPRESQLGAWASRQSEPLETGGELYLRLARYAARYAFGRVPRPTFWSGYRLAPEAIEFWRKKRYRLHERVLYKLLDGVWVRSRLYP